MHSLDTVPAIRPIHHWARALWLALLLTGCGGGVDSGGTGATPASFASGPITGFGSVIVNGVRFDDSKAVVTDDEGGASSRDRLQLGMTTEIRGSAITTDSTGAFISTASKIVFGSDILGRVDSIDLAAKRLVVLGQSVDVNTTVYDRESLSGGLSALVVGDVVEVYALFDAAKGRYTATRIERKGEVKTYRLRGVVSNLDVLAKAFNIGSERISYAGFTGAFVTPSNGSFVRVRLNPVKVGSLWLVAGLKDGTPKPGERDEVRLEGRVSSFESQARFSVNGVAVNASGVPPLAGLALGVRVEVEGTASDGVLMASKLEIETDDEVEKREVKLLGLITSVDAANLSFVLRDQTVSYTLTGSPTKFDNGTAANLVVGVNVEARGVMSADRTRLLAAEIKFK